MMNKILKNKFIKPILYFIVIAIFIFLIVKVTIIKEIISLIILSFILSYTLRPLYKALMERGIKPQNAALILILSLAIGAIIILTVLIPSVFRESLSLGSSLEEIEQYTSNLYHKMRLIGNNKTIYTIFDNIYNKANNFLIHLFDKLLDTTGELGENALAFVIVPIITYYFLSDSEYIGNKLLLLCPLKGRKIIKKINKDIDKILGRYIVGQFMLCALVSILTFFILFFLKVKFPIILSILNGLFNIIPYFGPIFGMVLPVIVAFLTSSKTALYTIIWLYAVQLVEGNILSPKITGESVSMHPLVVIVLLLIGGKIGGFWGMVLAVPIGVIIKVIYDDLNYYLF